MLYHTHRRVSTVFYFSSTGFLSTRTIPQRHSRMSHSTPVCQFMPLPRFVAPLIAHRLPSPNTLSKSTPTPLVHPSAPAPSHPLETGGSTAHTGVDPRLGYLQTLASLVH